LFARDLLYLTGQFSDLRAILFMRKSSTMISKQRARIQRWVCWYTTVERGVSPSAG